MTDDEEIEVLACDDPECETENKHYHCTDCNLIIYPPWHYNRYDELVCITCRRKEENMREHINKTINQ